MAKKRNNRTAGHNYERLIGRELKEFGYNTKTTRQESHTLDALKIDVIADNMPFHIQCKTTNQTFNYSKFYTKEYKEQDKPNLIFHKKTKRANTNFVTEGEYVIMKKEDFYKLLELINK